jgi:hypothetical protein
MYVILIVLLVLLLLGGVPSLGYHQYGWGPSGAVGVILIILVVLLLMGRL